MKKLVKLALLTAALTVASLSSALAVDTCESLQGKSCRPPGFMVPCMYAADGSPGLCTCAGGRLDCLV